MAPPSRSPSVSEFSVSEFSTASFARASSRVSVRLARPLAGALLACVVGSAQVSAAAPASTERAGKSSSSQARDLRAAEPSPADRAAAQALYEEGRALMEQGRAADACPRFEESERLEPGLGTRFHLATCYEALGKLASAHALFLDVAAEAAQRKQAEREKVARERARAVEPLLSRLTIEVPFASSPALQVERDGKVVGSAQWGLPVPVDPGVHRVSASAPGREPWAAEVSVPSEGGVTRINVPPLPEHSQPFFAPLSRKVGLAALGVGAGTLALGGVFAAQAISKKNASDREGCGEQVCTSPAGLSLRREALAAGDRATWAMGLGLVSVGAAAALFWVWPTSDDGEPTNVELSPVADLRSASLRLSGRF
jgi:hypothetical protein